MQPFAAMMQFGRRHAPARLAVVAGLLLLFGLLVLPALIYGGGLGLLGRYEGASLHATYASIFGGLARGSPAAWIAVLGPCGLWLLWFALRAWWRVGEHPA